MPTVEVNPNMVDMMNLHHLVPPANINQGEEFADPLTPEEEVAVAIAEAEHARGEYYTWDPNIETLEAFFDRIDADPIGTMACNSPEWKHRQIIEN